MQNAIASHSAGYLFKKLSLLILLAMIIRFAWIGQDRIVLLLGLALATAAFSKLWAKLALIRVSCTRTLDKTRVFPGEVVRRRLEVANRKPLPLPWMEIDEEVSAALMQERSLDPCNRRGFGLFRSSVALRWYSSVGWEHTFECRKRGFYPLGSITLTSGDIFGFYAYSRQHTDSHTIVVYPRIYPLIGISFPSRTPLGESKADQDIFHDPSRIIGLRDYTHNDSLRHVHWKASAKRRQLQVKVFESTLTLTTALFLGVDDFSNHPADAEFFELAVSTTASIAARLIGQKSRVGLFANTWPVDSNRHVNLPPGSSQGHLTSILESLAKINAVACTPLADLIGSEHRMFAAGCTIVTVVAGLNRKLKERLLDLKMRGHKVIVIAVKENTEDHPEAGLTQFQATLHSQSHQIYLRKTAL